MAWQCTCVLFISLLAEGSVHLYFLIWIKNGVRIYCLTIDFKSNSNVSIFYAEIFVGVDYYRSLWIGIFVILALICLLWCALYWDSSSLWWFSANLLLSSWLLCCCRFYNKFTLLFSIVYYCCCYSCLILLLLQSAQFPAIVDIVWRCLKGKLETFRQYASGRIFNLKTNHI